MAPLPEIVTCLIQPSFTQPVPISNVVPTLPPKPPPMPVQNIYTPKTEDKDRGQRPRTKTEDKTEDRRLKDRGQATHDEDPGQRPRTGDS